jgi:tryptophan synthase beta subunit
MASPPPPSRAVRLGVRVYMGEEDMRRQRLNVFRCVCSARVVSVTNGSRTLKTPSAKPCAIG